MNGTRTYLLCHEEMVQLFLRDHSIIVCVDDSKLDAQLLDYVVLEARLFDPVRHGVGRQKAGREATGIGLLDELAGVLLSGAYLEV